MTAAAATSSKGRQAGFSDGTWSYLLTGDGVITVTDGPSNVGAKYLPGSASYATVVWNLSRLPGAKQRMLAVCPGMRIKAPPVDPPVQSFTPPAEGTTTALVPVTDALPPPDQGVPIYQRWYFWPALGIGAASILTGLILFWSKKATA